MLSDWDVPQAYVWHTSDVCTYMVHQFQFWFQLDQLRDVKRCWEVFCRYFSSWVTFLIKLLPPCQNWSSGEGIIRSQNPISDRSKYLKIGLIREIHEWKGEKWQMHMLQIWEFVNFFTHYVSTYSCIRNSSLLLAFAKLSIFSLVPPECKEKKW